MINLLFENPVLFFVSVASLIIAITVHEFSHAIAADRLGDPTPRLQGRISLNPVRHLDLYGSLFILFIGFGWGKPVEYDPFNLRDVRRDSAIIGFAGPLSNIILAVLASLIGWLFNTTLGLPSVVTQIIFLFIYMNVGLAVFNMIPVAPLDGFKIVGGLLPADKAPEWYALERYGLIFMMLLIVPLGSTSMVGFIIRPITNLITNFLGGFLL